MWVRIEDDTFDHPKFKSLTDHAIALWVRGLAFCGHWLTDGRVHPSFVRGKRQAGVADQLVAAGIWHVAKHLQKTCADCWKMVGGQPGDGWVVHDFLKYNFSKLEQERRQAEARAIKVAGGRARATSAHRERGRFTPADDQQGTSRTPADLLDGSPADDQQATSTVLVVPDTKETALVVNGEGLARLAELARALPVGKDVPSVTPGEVRAEAGRTYGRALTREELA